MTYRNKYVKTARKTTWDGTPGRHQNPDLWVTGPDPIRRDKYYAWMKHKAQAKFRGEDYELEFEDWERLWPDEAWFNRGRGRDCLILSRRDWAGAWSVDNCEIITKLEYGRRHSGGRGD